MNYTKNRLGLYKKTEEISLSYQVHYFIRCLATNVCETIRKPTNVYVRCPFLMH